MFCYASYFLQGHGHVYRLEVTFKILLTSNSFKRYKLLPFLVTFSISVVLSCVNVTPKYLSHGKRQCKCDMKKVDKL